jgi:hypothetical protein
MDRKMRDWRAKIQDEATNRVAVDDGSTGSKNSVLDVLVDVVVVAVVVALESTESLWPSEKEYRVQSIRSQPVEALSAAVKPNREWRCQWWNHSGGGQQQQQNYHDELQNHVGL